MEEYDSDNIDPELENELYCQFYLEEYAQEEKPEPKQQHSILVSRSRNNSVICIPSSESCSEEEEDIIDLSDSPELNISTQDNSRLNRSMNSTILCILCGQAGHSKKVCSEKYCFLCFAPGHLSCDCKIKNKLDESICSRCKTRGHTELICPEIWRQFKTTSEPNSPVVKTVKPSGRGCCFCGNPHHISDSCKKTTKKTASYLGLPKVSVRKYDQINIYKQCEKAITKIRRKIRNIKKNEKKERKQRKFSQNESTPLAKRNKMGRKSDQPSDNFSNLNMRDSIKVVNRSTNDDQGESFISLSNLSVKTEKTPRKSQKRNWNYDSDIFTNGSSERPKKNPRKSFFKKKNFHNNKEKAI